MRSILVVSFLAWWEKADRKDWERLVSTWKVEAKVCGLDMEIGCILDWDSFAIIY
jgi:hypothetical protein